MARWGGSNVYHNLHFSPPQKKKTEKNKKEKKKQQQQRDKITIFMRKLIFFKSHEILVLLTIPDSRCNQDFYMTIYFYQKSLSEALPLWFSFLNVEEYFHFGALQQVY